MELLARPNTQRRIVTFVAAGALAIAPMVTVSPAFSASPDTGETPAVVAAASAKKKPAKSNLKYSLAAKIYTGKARAVSVKARVSGMGKITVYYQGTSGTKYAKSKTAPKKVGAYTVSVKIAAGKKFRAAMLKLGTMKIVSKWKITFNANGGKIGSAKKKSIFAKNKVKLGKLPAAKRSGYSLQGWYTKKSGGSKISASTKATKNATYYARWTKTLVLDKKLLGTWSWVTGSGASSYYFYADGTYNTLLLYDGTWQDVCIYGRGNWSASAGKLKLTNREIQSAESSTCAHDSWKDSKWGPWKPANPVSTTEYYKLGTDEYGKYAIIETERIKNGEDYMKYQFDPS